MFYLGHLRRRNQNQKLITLSQKLQGLQSSASPEDFSKSAFVEEVADISKQLHAIVSQSYDHNNNTTGATPTPGHVLLQPVLSIEAEPMVTAHVITDQSATLFTGANMKSSLFGIAFNMCFSVDLSGVSFQGSVCIISDLNGIFLHRIRFVHA